MADKIYKLWKSEDNKICSKTLLTADLEFDKAHPIETVSVYETENIKKIYWVNGKNQPRFINIEADTSTLTTEALNFVPTLELNEQINITKIPTGKGTFPSGTIQYAFTYFNLYGQESNIFYFSDIFYTSYTSRGGNPEETVGNSFDISILKSSLSINFNYVRIYSIIRTSADNDVLIRKVTDLFIDFNNAATHLYYTDTGTTGETMTSTHLLYVGGEPIISKTMCQKDNSLFIGNIKLLRPNAGSLSVGGVLLKDILKNNASVVWNSNNVLYTTTETDSYYGYVPNLDKTDSELTLFKRGNYYRLGIQFQHISGKWSEPLFLQDSLCIAAPSTTNNAGVITVSGNSCIVTINGISTSITELKNNGYIKARGVIVYPTGNDKGVLCQGVVTPTVFNVADRYHESVYAMSSWFFRPVTNLTGYTTFDKGSLLEYRHLAQLPGNQYRNSEIEGTTDVIETGVIIDSDTASNKNLFVDKYRENFFIDASIVTLHSPELEWDDTINQIDENEFEIKIVGAINLTGHTSDIYVNANSSEAANGGFHKKTFNLKNINTAYGGASLVTSPTWYDFFKTGKQELQKIRYIYNGDTYYDIETVKTAAGLQEESELPASVKIETYAQVIDSSGVCYYIVYPWNSEAPISAGYDNSDLTPSALIQKKLANLKYAAFNYYLNSPISCGDSIIKYVSDTENTVMKVSSVDGSFTYQSNVDKIIVPSMYKVTDGLDKSKGCPKQILKISDQILNNINTETDPVNLELSFNSYGEYLSLGDDAFKELNSKDEEEYYNRVFRHDPTNIKFSSSTHAVFKFENNKCLPGYGNSIAGTSFWGETVSSTEVATISENGFLPQNYLWLVELHRKNINTDTLFGGTTEDAFEANRWLPAGEAVLLSGSSIVIPFTKGDTYLQRYDCLKTYPTSVEDKQTVVEILSFLCETYLNIDGRYDRNRGDISNLVMSPKNFNLLNKSYTQQDNYFVYNGISYNKFDLDDFPNTVTWTASKHASEEIDSWTKLTLSSTIDADGTYGKIRALRMFNNEIYGFQDQGIFNILYNSRVQISPSDGVPIELSTSDTVQGKRYVSNLIGCKNKWAIKETPKGLYFIDELSKAIYLLNTQSVNNLSETKGFRSWMSQHLKNRKEWTPDAYLNFTVHFDKNHSNVYFVDDTQCLNYNETLQEFTSFYSYERTPFMFNIWDKFIMIKNNKLWEYGAGDYNSFFGTTKNYYSKYIVNPDFQLNKTFTNVEFIADVFDSENNILFDPPYDYLKVCTDLEYDKSFQFGTLALTEQNCIASSIKQKFRTWRTIMPRSDANVFSNTRPLSPHRFNKDRIKNHWIYLELGNNKGLNQKTTLHSLIVYYTS